jgi:hypothetical protein
MTGYRANFIFFTFTLLSLPFILCNKGVLKSAWYWYGHPWGYQISGRSDIVQHSDVLSYLCHNFPILTNRNVAVVTGHIHWMIVVLCWSHSIGCERDNDVLLFHTRISVLTLQWCVNCDGSVAGRHTLKGNITEGREKRYTAIWKF